MGFLTPLAFAGLALLAVPLWLHLVERKERAGLPFPSLMFLQRMEVKLSSRKTLRDPLLLLIRCLAIIFCCLAFAQFYIERDPLETAGPEPVSSTVFLVDNSHSMAPDGDFAPVQSLLEAEINRLEANSRAALIKFSSQPRLQVPMTHEIDTLRIRADQIEASHAASNYGPAFALAERVLASERTQTQRIVLISDLQPDNNPGSTTPALREGIELRIVQAVNNESPDFWLQQTVMEQVNEGSETVTRELTASFENALEQTVSPARVDVTVDDYEAGSFFYDPGQDNFPGLTFELPRFRDAGINLQTDDGVLNHFMVNPADRRQSALLVHHADDEDRIHFLKQSLQLALQEAFRLASIGIDRLGAADLKEVDLVVFDAMDALRPDIANPLEDYTATGGSVLYIAPRRPVQTLADIVPGSWHEVQSDHSNGMQFESGHPFSPGLVKRLGSSFFAAPVYQHYRVAAQNDDQVLARYNGGDIALISRDTGAGARIMALTTRLDSQWSSLPQSPSFALMIDSIAGYLGNRPTFPHQLNAGTTMRLHHFVSPELRQEGTDHQITVQNPEGQISTFNANNDRYHFAEPGFYRIQASGEQQPVLVAVNVNSSEYSVRRLEPERFRSGLSILPRRASPAEQPLQSMQQEAGSVWWWLLLLGLLMLVFEPIMASRPIIRSAP